MKYLKRGNGAANDAPRDTPHDRVTLTVTERRALALLEERTGSEESKLARLLTSRWHNARLRCRRLRHITVVSGFVVGVVLMTATFVRWPVIAIVGLVLQAATLWVLLNRRGHLLGGGLSRWIKARTKVT